MEIHAPLKLRRLGEDRYVLVQPYVFNDGDITYMIPAGFETDLASVPGAARWILSRAGTHAAAVVHDYAYTNRRLICYVREADGSGRFTTEAVSKDEADELFLKHLRMTGVSSAKAQIMYPAVSLFGSAAWNHKTKN